MDRNAASQSHSLGGSGVLNLSGTLYLTDSFAMMNNQTCSQYQTLSFAGSSFPNIQGNIITSAFSMSGTALTMNLSSTTVAPIRQIALVQ